MADERKHAHDGNRGDDSRDNDASEGCAQKDVQKSYQPVRPRRQDDDLIAMNPEQTRELEQMLKTIKMTPPIDPAIFDFARNLPDLAQLRDAFTSPVLRMQQEYAEFAAQNAAIVADIVNRNRQWQQAIESFASMASTIVANQLAPFRQALQDHADTMARMYRDIGAISDWATAVADMLHRNWTPILTSIEQWRESFRAHLLEAFVKMHLWPTPSMTPYLVEVLASYAEAGNMRAVVLTVWNHYNRDNQANLEQMIETWWDDPEFAARRSIIEQALQGHRQRMYALTIPALLAQAEGIAGDFVRNNLIAGQSAPKLGKSGQVVQHAVKAANDAALSGPDGVGILHAVMADAVIEYVQQIAFENTDFASEYADLRQQREMNRHATLHGIQIGYPKAMNSLRCFLLLDALYGLRAQARLALVASSQTK